MLPSVTWWDSGSQGPSPAVGPCPWTQTTAERSLFLGNWSPVGDTVWSAQGQADAVTQPRAAAGFHGLPAPLPRSERWQRWWASPGHCGDQKVQPVTATHPPSPSLFLSLLPGPRPGLPRQRRVQTQALGPGDTVGLGGSQDLRGTPPIATEEGGGNLPAGLQKTFNAVAMETTLLQPGAALGEGGADGEGRLEAAEVPWLPPLCQIFQ